MDHHDIQKKPCIFTYYARIFRKKTCKRVKLDSNDLDLAAWPLGFNKLPKRLVPGRWPKAMLRGGLQSVRLMFTCGSQGVRRMPRYVMFFFFDGSDVVQT